MTKLLFSLFCLACSIQVGAQQNTIRLLTEYLPPFQQYNADGDPDGFAVDVVSAICKQLKLPAQIEMLPWARAYEIALSEPNIVLFSTAKTEERRDKFHWIGDFKYQRFFFWGLKSQFSQPISNIETLRQYRIAVAKQYNSDQFLIRNGFSKLTRVVKNEQMVGMLYRKRIDIILANEMILKQKTAEMGLDFSELVPLYEAQSLGSMLGIAMSLSSDPKLVAQFEQAYYQLAKSGELAKLKSQWQITDDITLADAITHHDKN